MGPVLIVADRVVIKQILVKDFHLFRNRGGGGSGGPGSIHQILSKSIFVARDDQWRQIRTIFSPTFTAAKLRHMYGLMDRCSADLIGHFDNSLLTTAGTETADGTETVAALDLRQTMGTYTMDVIARCAFGIQSDVYLTDNQLTSRVNQTFAAIPVWRLILTASLPKFWWKLVDRLVSLVDRIVSIVSGGKGGQQQQPPSENVSHFFIQLSRDFIKKRLNREVGAVGTDGQPLIFNDFLQLMIDSSTDNDSNGQLNNNSTRRLTENEILGQCYVFFIAGYDALVSALAYCLHELAVRPELQDRLYDEISGLFADNESTIDYNDLKRLEFMDAVLKETLRHYPPVINLERETRQDVTLTDRIGSSSIVIANGTQLEIPVYAIHHDRDYYPEPDLFEPNRFMSTSGGGADGGQWPPIESYTYMPFGLGPRNCLGTRLAVQSAKLALVKLVSRYRFSPVADTQWPPEFISGASRRFQLQADRLIVGIHKRVVF
ncbi:cytochrome P450 3A31-like [Oppia nitens]|uniref:cytochrome P450 3A31-like n=1 Tax=Oppia nitens TaxID=1686743 RepID=UPI0023DBF09A|nr:cytochrome P450 3A31-like [Oppia nitens]